MNRLKPRQEFTLLGAATTVGSLTLLSRIFGFGRDMMMASLLGAGSAADAFLVALQIPNLFRRLFGEGAFAAAFVPIISRLFATQDRQASLVFIGHSLGLMIALLILLLGILQVWTAEIIRFIAPGLSTHPETHDLAIMLTHITALYLPPVILVALWGAVLNADGRFAATAATPLIFNVVLIGCLMASARLSPPDISVRLAWAVAASGFVQLGFMCWHARSLGLIACPRVPSLRDPMASLLQRLGPLLLAHGTTQITLIISTILASTLPAGAIASLYYADRVVQLPLGVVGVALATSLLPKLARARAEGSSMTESENRAVEFALFLTLPAAAALALLADPVTLVLFERGRFGPDEAVATAWALAIYSLGLPAFVLAKLLMTGYFAHEDSRTPLLIALITLVIYSGLGWYLKNDLGYRGLAMATVVSAWAQLGLLLGVRWYRHHAFQADMRLRHRLPRIFLATTMMLITLALAELLLAETSIAPGGETEGRIIGMIILLATGLVAYFGSALLIGGISRRDLAAMVRR